MSFSVTRDLPRAQAESSQAGTHKLAHILDSRHRLSANRLAWKTNHVERGPPLSYQGVRGILARFGTCLPGRMSSVTRECGC